MLNLNTPNKQWNMYLNTLSSISGDDLTIKPDTRRNLLLEVSGNNNIFIKKGTTSYTLTNLITGDTSFSNVDVSNNLNPLTNNSGSLGSFNKLWNNAYIRDISATNISISGNMTMSGTISNVIRIIPRLANDISSSLGNSANIWQQAFIRDLSSISTINGSTWPLRGPTGATGLVGATGPTGPIGPAGTTSTATWNDISNLTLTTKNRIYQEISGDISWNAVNGYYGLAKDAYPSLNPLSSRVKATSNWSLRPRINSTALRCVCWSPELRLFVALSAADSIRVVTSSDGMNWIPVTNYVESIGMRSVCWSPQLRIFLGVGYGAGFAPEGGRYGFLKSSDGTNWSAYGWDNISIWSSICWSPELSLFVIVADGGNYSMAWSSDGLNWTLANQQIYIFATSVCWSAELRLFVAVTRSQSGLTHVLYSSDGKNWNFKTITPATAWYGVCWSKELGIFVAVGGYGPYKVMTSSNGIDWIMREIAVQVDENYALLSVCWSPELSLFVAITYLGSYRIATSPNGINWNYINIASNQAWNSICWSPELGIFVGVGAYGSGGNIVVSSLKGRPPTSYNVFDSSFNSIDENGKWDFSNINVTTLTVSNGPSISSDDRLKHNEVVINNGLDIIDQVTPKFYQKTQVLLDASYNGDLSGYAWNYEAGLIAQELLQIPDLSFTVGGGDYYEQTYNLIKQTNDLSNAYYDLSNAYYDLSNSYYGLSNANYDLSNTNYEISYNLIAQPYNVNYNSVFVYGLAAIKELHAKVKAQEATLLNQKNIVTSLLTKIAILENNRTNQ